MNPEQQSILDEITQAFKQDTMDVDDEEEEEQITHEGVSCDGMLTVIWETVQLDNLGLKSGFSICWKLLLTFLKNTRMWQRELYRV